MREIKFRGKRVVNGEWVYGHYVYMYDKHCIKIAKPINEFGVEEGVTEIYEVDPETVGQYTEQKDNGREVYEDDLYQSRNIVYQIYYSEKLAQFIGKVAGTNRITTNDVGTLINECEYIGNIHDNPEFLKD